MLFVCYSNNFLILGPETEGAQVEPSKNFVNFYL